MSSAAPMSGADVLGGLLFIVIVLTIYLMPTFIAAANAKRNILAIGVLNVLLGWTVLGWLICLIWALLKDSQAPQQPH